MQTNKDEIRAELRATRAAMSREAIAAESERIVDRVLQLREFKTAHCVGIYIAATHEVQTRALIHHCKQTGRRFCAPIYDADAQRYRYSKIGIDTDFIPGRMRIPEPHPADPIDLKDCDLVIVPGVAFDATGTRLGHGGGHFDRLLEQSTDTHPLRVGLAFNCQIVPELPRAETDIPMHLVITPDGIVAAND